MQVELEATGEKQEKEKVPDTEPEAETPDFPFAEDGGKESSPEVHDDHEHPGSATAGLQKHEEKREQEEETQEKPAGETHPSVLAEGEGTESLQDSFKHQETLESQESPDTDMSEQTELKEQAIDGEIKVMESTEVAAEEITQPEEPEPEPQPQPEPQPEPEKPEPEPQPQPQPEEPEPQLEPQPEPHPH